jgi:hypothetical protein
MAAADPIALYCARGVPDYPDAEMRLNVGGRHVVHVTYVGFQPSRTRAEWSLRDCLNTAIKLDSSRDIQVSLWYRARHSREVQELMKKRLVYRAASGLVEESAAP